MSLAYDQTVQRVPENIRAELYKLRYFNKNAAVDAAWDVMQRLGNRNQYTSGSASHKVYELVYATYQRS